MKETWTELKGEIDSRTIIVGDFNVPISIMVSMTTQKIDQLINLRDSLRNTGKNVTVVYLLWTQDFSLQNSKFITDFYFHIIHLQGFIGNMVLHSNKCFLHDFSTRGNVVSTI